MNIEIKKIDDIKPNDYNPNKIPEELFNTLKENIKKFGYLQPIFIDEQNTIIDGEHRWKAAKECGLNELQCVIYKGNGDIKEYKKLLTLSMNHLRGENDEQAFENVIKDLAYSLDYEEIEKYTGFDSNLIADIIQADKYAGKEGIEDDVPEMDECLAIKEGDIIELGKHRLMCGDSTKEDDVNKLMNGNKTDMVFTSPPYNAGKTPTEIKMGLNSKYKNSKDNDSQKEYMLLLQMFTDIYKEKSNYLFVNIQSISGNKLALIEYLYKYKKYYADTIIWDKINSQPAMANNVLNSRYEYIHILSHKANRSIGVKSFRGNIDNIIQLSTVGKKDKIAKEHHAVFPIELAEYFIDRFSINDCIDPSLGSGSTLIACEKTGRICYGMELDRHYCSVIIERYCKYVDNYKIKVNGKEINWNEYKTCKAGD